MPKPKVNKTGRVAWNREDDARLRVLCGGATPISGKDEWQEVATQFPGRTRMACFRRWRRLVSNESRRMSPRRFYNGTGPTMPKRVPMQQPIALPEYASITAFVCGDPLPGRSALDKRMQGSI